jgi:uncharacterized protein
MSSVSSDAFDNEDVGDLYRHRPIDRKRCEELLAGQSVGRVAWQSSQGLQLLPISYMWHNGAIVFRTSPYAVLAELTRPTDVVFEVDELTPTRRSGWSVMVTGRAAEVASAADIARLWELEGPVPWAGGTRNLFIRIAPRAITGRQISPE